MEIYTAFENLQKNDKLIVAIGTFDGMHLGHRRIISRAKELAKDIGGLCAVLTFSNHPLSVIAPELEPLHILNEHEKRMLLADFGVNVLFDVPFTEEIAGLTAADFIELLQIKLSPAVVVVGENFSFGRGAEGNAILLEKLGEEKGIKIVICPTVMLDGKAVSSTRLRRAVKVGNLSELNRCLGFEYFVCGEVVHGDERGRLIGFPTANFLFESNRALLPDGAYAVKIDVKTDDMVIGSQNDVNYHNLYGIANIGSNPTFDGQERRLEVHIFNFAADIYGLTAIVRFATRLRGEKKFATVDELVAQLNEDKGKALNLFGLQK